MDELHYKEMVKNVALNMDALLNKKIFLFGHCNATEQLIDVLDENKIQVEAILDNNPNKYNLKYGNICVVSPDVLRGKGDNIVVCIVARAFAAMKEQLNNINYSGWILQLASYDNFSEYSLDSQVIKRRRIRVASGIVAWRNIKKKHFNNFFIVCPFSALGDVYMTMSYLPAFLQKTHRNNPVILVVGNAQGKVARLFQNDNILVFSQEKIDEIIQAILYLNDQDGFIAHQDRPYVINISNILYKKMIPLERLYKEGVFGLDKYIEPIQPKFLSKYIHKDRSLKNSVIISPYAKSVPSIPFAYWEKIIRYYHKKGKKVFTNVSGKEKTLKGTDKISPQICEMRDAVEQAGIFIGIRSGICDVIQKANCRKIALYPNYFYTSTRWKAIDVYFIHGWENIQVGDDISWLER